MTDVRRVVAIGVAADSSETYSFTGLALADSLLAVVAVGSGSVVVQISPDGVTWVPLGGYNMKTDEVVRFMVPRAASALRLVTDASLAVSATLCVLEGKIK